MPGRRGPADWVSEADEEKLLADLESYVCAMRTKGLLLWYFGQYGTEVTKLSMEKRAPAISALLDNADLFKVILKYSPFRANVRQVLRQSDQENHHRQSGGQDETVSR